MGLHNYTVFKKVRALLRFLLLFTKFTTFSMSAHIEQNKHSVFIIDWYVKVCLLRGDKKSSRIKKRKTCIQRAAHTPSFNEIFIFRGECLGVFLQVISEAICKVLCRLQQPWQNPISDNTNVLWNSPSLGKNYSYRLPLVL